VGYRRRILKEAELPPAARRLAEEPAAGNGGVNPMSPEEKLRRLGYEIKPIQVGGAPLVPWVQTGNLLYLSGRTPGYLGKTWNGQLGKEYTIEEGYEAARDVAVGQLAAAKSALGELSRIRRVVKVLGMVNCIAGFTDQPRVINGFSELLVEVFGEVGRHARSAVGLSGLPGNAPVEIEVIFEVE
jgi:enamine deaminase RidA (YjgF/YER057c/UK114 family)